MHMLAVWLFCQLLIEVDKTWDRIVSVVFNLWDWILYLLDLAGCHVSFDWCEQYVLNSGWNSFYKLRRFQRQFPDLRDLFVHVRCHWTQSQASRLFTHRLSRMSRAYYWHRRSRQYIISMSNLSRNGFNTARWRSGFSTEFHSESTARSHGTPATGCCTKMFGPHSVRTLILRILWYCVLYGLHGWKSQ